MFRLLVGIVLFAIIFILVLPFILFYAGVNIFPANNKAPIALPQSQQKSATYNVPRHFGALIRTEDGGDTWQDAARAEHPTNTFPTTIYSFIAHPHDKNILFLGGAQSGLWKSINAGRTWNPMNDQQGILDAEADIYDIEISHANPDTIYLAVYEKNHGRILQSRDGGKRFKELYATSAENKSVFDVLADAADPKHILAITGEKTLIETTNNGTTWRIKKLFDKPLVRLIANPDDSHELYAVNEDGEVIKSNTGGSDWSPSLGQEQNPQALEKYPPDIFNFTRKNLGGLNTVFMLDPVNSRHVYLATDKLLLRSPDAGQTWNEVHLLFAEDLLPVTAVAIYPHKSSILFVAADHQLQKSIDDGATWSNVPFPPGLGATKLFIHPQDSRIMFAIIKK